MKIFLAGGHICGKYQQIKDYENLLSRRGIGKSETCVEQADTDGDYP